MDLFLHCLAWWQTQAHMSMDLHSLRITSTINATMARQKSSVSLLFIRNWELIFLRLACISDDGAVVQLGRTYVNQGVRHKCNVQGDSVTYEQGRDDDLTHRNWRIMAFRGDVLWERNALWNRRFVQKWIIQTYLQKRGSRHRRWIDMTWNGVNLLG